MRGWRVRTAAIAIAAMVCSTSSAPASGRASAKQGDFDEYNRLLDETQAAHQAIVDAGASPSDELFERAADADTALIDWIHRFTASDDFGSLGAADRTALMDSLHVAHYLRASARLPLGRCGEARDELQALLADDTLSPQLRPQVETATSDAELCLSEPQVIQLQLDVQPPDARVAVDGVPVGSASDELTVEPGSHVLTLSAPGHEPIDVPIDVAADQRTVAVGPIALTPEAETPPVEPSDDGPWPPTWYEWTLWGAGVVFIATGAGFWANARDIEDQAERATGGSVDPVNQDAIDAEETRAIVFWTLGIASAAAGTILFFVLDDDDEAPEAGTVTLRPGGHGLTVWF